MAGRRRRPLELLRLGASYWSGERKRRARSATLGLFALTLAQVGLTVWGNYWNRALFDELEARSVPGVLVQVGVFVLLLACSIGVTAAHLLVKRGLQLDWRAWLGEQLIGRWMSEGRHYRLLFSPGEHDNPDQRISEDIRIATESAIALVHTLVYSLLSLGLFVDILWNVSGSIRLPGSELEVPGYLVPLAFLYAGAGSALGWIFGRPLVRSTDALQGSEADFRFGLARAREHAEAIALAHGEPMERRGAVQRFGRIARDWDRQSYAYLGIVSFTTAYGALLPVFPLLVAAPQYIAGAMSLGMLMQAAQAFQRVASALSWPVDNLGELARCRASAERVLALYADIEALCAKGLDPETPCIDHARGSRDELVIEDLCVSDPDGGRRLEHFSAVVAPAERVLVTGDSTAASSLLKAISGLWPWGSGRVRLPAEGDLFFVPRDPFLPEGSLRQTLCYPLAESTCDDARIRHALECVELGALAPRLDEVENWEQTLDPRAQQRLGFARVLMRRPAWICLDGATDALDPASERAIFETLRRELPDSAWITISYHPGLESLHDRTLRLRRGAGQRSEAAPEAFVRSDPVSPQ